MVICIDCPVATGDLEAFIKDTVFVGANADAPTACQQLLRNHPAGLRACNVQVLADLMHQVNAHL